MLIIGGGSGGGEGVPTGSIVISGKDMSEEKYGNLDAPLVLHKDNEPDLWEIYKETAGQWSETHNNLIDRDIYRFGNNIFGRFTGYNTGEIGFFTNFDGSDEVVYTLPFTSGTMWSTFKNCIDNQALFVGSNDIHLMDFDGLATTAQDFVDSISFKAPWVFPAGSKPVDTYLTKKGIFGIYQLAIVYKFPTDDVSWGDDSSVTQIDLKALFPYGSDPLTEKYITINGFYITRGVACNIETLQQKTIEYNDYSEAFSYFHKNGVDYFSADGVLGAIDEDFNLTVYDNITNVGSNDVADFVNIDNTLLSSSFSNYNGKTEGGVFSSITSRRIISNENIGSNIDKKCQASYCANGGRIGKNDLDNEVFFMQFLSESPDIFTIDAVDSISTDKSAWIKLQQKGL